MLHQHAEGAANERRDMFAAMALQGMLACGRDTQLCDEVAQNPARASEWSYQYADAMLKAREQSSGDAHD